MTDFKNSRNLVGAALKTGKQMFALNRQREVIRQGPDDKHIPFVEGILFVALNIQDTQDAVLDF